MFGLVRTRGPGGGPHHQRRLEDDVTLPDGRTFDTCDRAVDGEHDVFGDGSVVLLPTPGHTAGHQSLWIRPKTGTQFVLTADACYTQKHLEKTILPTNAYDPAQMTIRSLSP